MQPLLVYITCPGHSGSTLLSLMLDNNSRVRSLGEVHRVRLAWLGRSKPCTCGQEVAVCPFWLAVQHELARRLARQQDSEPLGSLEFMLHKEKHRVVADVIERAVLVAGGARWARALAGALAPHHRDAIRNSLALYESVRAVAGVPVVVDSTKDARRLAWLKLAAPESLRAVYLFRDGRAVVASEMRRLGNEIATASRNWAADHRRIRHSLRTLPPRQSLVLRYEELCQEPQRVLSELCGWLGVPYEPGMLELRKAEAHGISGNPMRLRHGEAAVVLDERWRQQLTTSDLAAFERVAGALNRRLGYLD